MSETGLTNWSPYPVASEARFVRISTRTGKASRKSVRRFLGGDARARLPLRPFIPVNARGNLPPEEINGVRYLKIPVTMVA